MNARWESAIVSTTVINHLLRVRERVITSHDAWTSRTFRVFTASLQRLKIVALIPAPADYEVRSIIKFWNAQSIAPIKIHRQLCQVYGHAQLDGQHISCRTSAGLCLIVIHSLARNSRSMIFIFSYTSWNSCAVSVSVFRMTGGNECHIGFNYRRQTS